MRVCDITKSEEVASRYLIVERPVENEGPLFDANGDPTTGVRVVRDIEVGKSAAQAIEASNWQDLHRLTPVADRPKNPERSNAAVKAGETRRANKEQKAREAAAADQAGE